MHEHEDKYRNHHSDTHLVHRRLLLVEPLAPHSYHLLHYQALFQKALVIV